MDELQKIKLVRRLKQFVEGEGTSLIFDEMQKDIALKIIKTNFSENVKREELYMLTKAIDELKVKLQEYVNEFQENE